jgi:chromosome segregation ATPase
LKGGLRNAVRGKTEDLKGLIDSHAKNKNAHAKVMSKVAGDMDATLEEHGQAKDDMDALLERIAELEDELKKAKKRGDEGEAKNAELMATLAGLQAKVADSDESKKALEDQVAGLEKHIKDLVKENNKLREDASGGLVDNLGATASQRRLGAGAGAAG